MAEKKRFCRERSGENSGAFFCVGDVEMGRCVGALRWGEDLCGVVRAGWFVRGGLSCWADSV